MQREQAEARLAEALTQYVEATVESMDFSPDESTIENMVESYVNDYDFSDAVEKALGNYDMSDAIQEAFRDESFATEDQINDLERTFENESSETREKVAELEKTIEGMDVVYGMLHERLMALEARTIFARWTVVKGWVKSKLATLKNLRRKS